MKSRVNWKRLSVACSLLVAAAGAARSAQSPPAVRRPNLILVLIDDMGWGDFSCFGNKDARTPNIDRLAAEGIRFTQFYVNSPICSPSRCALTTGQYPQRWRITSYLNNRADNARRGVADWLDPKAPSLARVLKSHGYATGHFGKWHLGGQRDVDNAPPISDYGFDESLTNFEGMGPKLLPLTLRPGQAQPGRIWADAERLGGPVTWMQRSRITTGYIDAARQFMDRAQRDGKPFYINLWPDDVHSPFWPPVEQWADTKRGLYLSVLRELDSQLGRLFEYLREDPARRDNTLVLVCSDNGPEPGAGSAGPFRGAKTRLYEGGVRSPLIAWGPGLVRKARAGSRDSTSVFAAFDLAPSLLRVAGVQAGGVSFDGENVSEALLGRAALSRRAPIFWSRPPDRKQGGPLDPQPQPDLAVRDGKWKLLCDYDGSRLELYDLENDPSERTNLAEREPEAAARLKAALLSWRRSMPSDRGPELGSRQEPVAPAAPPPPVRETRRIAGWNVHLSQAVLTEQPRLTERALELLKQQLEEIVRSVPAPAVEQLRRVPLYFSPEYPGVPPRAEYHPGAGWLRANGRDPAMEKAVEFTNVRIFEQEVSRMPNFALHELAHAYHDRFLPGGHQHAGVRAAFERAKASGSYDRVERRHGSGRPNSFDRAYALTNPAEYFAESTEAFFSRNDFYPFTRDELRRHDPAMHDLLRELWRVE